MAYIIETKNPYEPMKVDKHVHPGGISILEWLQLTYPEFKEFDVATICLVNGEARMRKDWDKKIGKDDIVNFITLPGEPATIALVIAIVVAIALAVTLALIVQPPQTPGETPASDPVFSVKGQNNTIRLGEPIEVCYGRNRIYPSFASRPFYQYIDNDQFQYSLFCLGQGEFDISQILIGDTDIGDYQEVEYEIIPPGELPTLFPSNVYTSPEAGGQTLFSPSDSEYTADGWVGPFAANPSGTETNRIEVDVVFPKGLYFAKNNGRLDTRTIILEAQMRLINDAGVPLGPFVTFLNPTITAKTTTPQRRTYSADVAEGRYQVRLRRSNEKEERSIKYPHRAGDEAVWEGMRSYLTEAPNFGDITNFGNVTILAVKIRATNNLNDRTAQKFNVIATRKLPVRNSDGTWTDPIPTRSIVWAFVDVFKSLYGGRVTDTYFDWDVLESLDALYASRNENFDWIFRDPITVWEAAKAVARAGRAIPLLSGSLITIKRDGPLEVPTTIFTPDNIIKGTFQWDIKLWDLDEHDSIQVEYTEPATGYKQEQVICTLPGGTTDNPQDVRISGIQDRDHAYHEGLYMLAVRKYLRENISFETGLEGFIPAYGDLIAVSHDVPRWSQSGYVVHAVEGASGRWHLYVSEPLIFEEGSDYEILLRGKLGNVLGPLEVFQTADPKQVIVPVVGTIDFLLGGENEPMIFLFGVPGNTIKLAKVVKIEPQGGERVKITAVNDLAVIHSFDELSAPPLTAPLLPLEVPDLPTISQIFLAQLDSLLQIIQVSWTAAFGAQRYIVQTSTDGENWVMAAETARSAVQLRVGVGELWVRVAAINEGQGPWIQEEIVIGAMGGLTINNPWDNDLEWGVFWTAVLSAAGYQIKVYDNSASAPVLKHTFTQTIIEISFLYDYLQASLDGNLVREMLLEVDVLFEDEETGEVAPSGSPETAEFSNEIPEAPSGLGHEIYTDDSDSITYRLFFQVPYEADLHRIKVWWSFVNGFDPGVDVPFVDETASEPGHENLPEEVLLEIPFDSFAGHDTIYWRVAVFDVWGNELSTNVSAQQVIPSYP